MTNTIRNVALTLGTVATILTGCLQYDGPIPPGGSRDQTGVSGGSSENIFKRYTPIPDSAQRMREAGEDILSFFEGLKEPTKTPTATPTPYVGRRTGPFGLFGPTETQMPTLTPMSTATPVPGATNPGIDISKIEEDAEKLLKKGGEKIQTFVPTVQAAIQTLVAPTPTYSGPVVPTVGGGGNGRKPGEYNGPVVPTVGKSSMLYRNDEISTTLYRKAILYGRDTINRDRRSRYT